ncbi:dermonecrotic toxin domain-containing protein [Pseudomonas sp.]|uniref:dermonecrotic toxin domain-containing protein n=1 Tax=Pseudomonas sp. TaxID=306 RepID=UPI003F38F415
MTDPVQPYFFDEAERASNARQPGDREKALGFTLDDLKWLKNVYIATQTARTVQKDSMFVYQLMLSVTGAPDIPLAGAFAMSRPDDGEVTLYTPWKGLIKFADMTDLENQLKEWLAQTIGKRELLRFLAIEQRSILAATTTPGISTQAIDGATFQEQQRILDHNQAQNIKAMIGELIKMPTLQSMLDDTLKHALHKPFPKLDQRLTELKSFVRTVSAFDGSDYQHTLSTLSLSDALLHFYLNNHWPIGDSRIFANPEHGVSSDADNQAWESAIKEIAQSFTPHLNSLLKTFWNTPMSIGQPRSEFFTECMRDTFHTKLLLQRQQGILTTQEYLLLMNVSAEPATNNPLRIEKLRVTAPLNHYAELASTLMIGGADTLGFLYTQSRGIEATSNLPAVKNIVLQMMKSEGHEDTLLNFMSLDERATFLALKPDERLIEASPVIGPVFKQLMTDILGKQRQNLSHALSRYRESEGTLDPHALLDNALDVRGLIDDRLLAAESAGRWSTRVDHRFSAQPATVRAESAKEELALLDSVAEALDQLLEKHPAIPATTSTLNEALNLVSSSVTSLQSSFTHTLETALRSELKLRTVTRTLSTTEQAIIKTVLDTPTHLLRASLNGFLPGVFSLALNAGAATNLVKVASCFVLTERGGLDPVHSGKAILWTPACGFEVFKALQPLLTELDRRLKDVDHRTSLLENLGRSDRLPGKAYTLAPLQKEYGHFLDYLQKPFVHLDQDCVNDALATKLSPAPLARLLNLVALRVPLTGLRHAADIARSLMTQQKLPVWLAKAPVEDLILHGELLQQYLDNVKDDQDYLTGIRSLRRTAHHELEKQLKADKYPVDPGKVQIRIKARPTIAASSQLLTDFALNHLKDLDQLHLTLASLDSTAIPDGMDERYVKDLVRNLNPGEHHQKILSDALADTPANADRRKRFYTQLPWQLMHYAHTEKLQERLSDTGFDLVRQVMDMPDAIARAAVDGAHALIRPLEFLGITATQSIKVPGVYLIGSSADNAAPQVLIAPHSPRHGVKEYENEAQLLAELKTRGPLLDWVLMNLPQPDRTQLEYRMAPSGSRTPRTSSATHDNRATAVTLASNPLKGHLFGHLFNDNAALLSRLLGCQSDDRKQGEWATIKQVLGEDVQAAYSFCMGKLAYPVTVWRSYRDIKQSAEDLQTHKWGAALRGFISGIAQLATLRQSLGAPAQPSAATAMPAPQTPGSRFNWHDVDVTAPERTRLKRHESLDVDLGSLTHDSALGLYTHPTTKKHYGPIEGKVYPVAKRGTHWRIASTLARGPRVHQNASRQWMVDGARRPRFSLANRFDTAITVWENMNVDARGMLQIRRLFPQMARQIDQALDLATTYVWNSFRNLQLLKAPGDTITPVHQLIMDFIGVPEVLPAHVDKIEKVVGDIFAAVLDPTLRKYSSHRFVVGRLIEDSETTFAFTVPTDIKRRIYLAEKFFKPDFNHYRAHLSDRAFPIAPHARAATLIHELSHLACKTEDIAYLDSSRPFADLIEATNPLATLQKQALTEVQDTALSLKTPYTRLFMLRDSDTGAWEDLGSTSSEDTDQIKRRILTMTGAENLSGARHTFKRDPLIRLDVQLANADSVTWLITQLGRRLHVSTP